MRASNQDPSRLLDERLAALEGVFPNAARLSSGPQQGRSVTKLDEAAA